MRPYQIRRLQRSFWLSFAVGAAGIAVACESGDGSSGSAGFQKITPTGQTLAIADFVGAGLKQSKKYDVTDLPGAVAA